jgi:hypothetical protein
MNKQLNQDNLEILLRPYNPSWYDRLSAWVDRIPIPNPIVYIIIGLILPLAGLIIRWLGTTGPILEWDPVYIVVVFQIFYVLYIIQYLDKLALKVLDDFQSALNPDGLARMPDLSRVISTLPARPTLLVCLGFMFFGLGLVITALLTAEDFVSTIQVNIDLFGFYTALVMIVLWFNNGLFIYHTYHQLKVVNQIYTQLTIVHPFHQQELFSFSGFSARTAVLIVATTIPWIIFDPGPISLVICIVFSIFGLLAFILPLIGVHQILRKEKDRLLDENGILLERSINRLTQRVKIEESDHLDNLDLTLSSLEKARHLIQKISTWPWRGETFRQLLVAIFLPTTIWLIQYILTEYIFK